MDKQDDDGSDSDTENDKGDKNNYVGGQEDIMDDDEGNRTKHK